MNPTERIPPSRILTVTGIVLIVAALALTVHNVWEVAAAGRAAESSLSELRAQMSSAPEPQFVFPSVDSEADGATDGADAPPDGDVPEDVTSVLPGDGTEYAGILSLPTLGLELPVIDRLTSRDLKRAPCRYFGSPDTQDLVIAGHNYTTHFGTLHSLREGDPVSFFSVSGEERRYSVRAVEILDPWQIDEMTAGEWPLTLFTCTVGGAARVTVRCSALP